MNEKRVVTCEQHTIKIVPVIEWLLESSIYESTLKSASFKKNRIFSSLFSSRKSELRIFCLSKKTFYIT